MQQAKAFQKYAEDRLKPGQTKITLDYDTGEVTYSARPREAVNAKPFKPLNEMTMKMLEDVVNHAKVKK